MDNTVSISALHPDKKNANRGTVRGKKMLAGSLREFGAGRSILIDKNNRIIAGNKTAEQAKAAGMNDVRVIETRGDELVAVKRIDLDLEKDAKAKGMALADNRTGEINLEWDCDILKEMSSEIDLGAMFTDDELNEIIDTTASIPEFEKKLAPKEFVRVLVSVPIDRATEAKEHLDNLSRVPDIEIDYSGN